MAKTTNGKKSAAAPGRLPPAIAFTHGESGDSSAAVAALADADRLEQLSDGPVSSRLEPDQPVSPDAAAAAASPQSGALPRAQAATGTGEGGTAGRVNGAPPPAPAKTPDAPAAPKLEKLTSKKYNGVKAEQLRAFVIDRDNRILELEAKLVEKQQAAPALVVEVPKTLELACGETIAIPFNLAALKFGDAAKLTPPQKSRLGEVWAPVVLPYLGSSEHAALIMAIAATSDVLFDKVFQVKTAPRADKATT